MFSLQKNTVVACIFLALTIGYPLSALGETPAPPGFVAGPSEQMRYADAIKYCTERDGRLPLVDGRHMFPSPIEPDTPIEGFGVQGGIWAPALRGATFWTGTIDSANPGHPLIVTGDVGIEARNRKIYIFTGRKDALYRTLCVQ